MPNDTEHTIDFSKISTREMSSIAFPYVDLDEAINVARAMLGRGGVAMDRDQISAAMGQVPGGGFNNKLSAAKQFGLVDNIQGKWQLTPLGFEILEPSREDGAKAQAFLNVELYKRTYDEYKGRILPPKHGLEHAFVSFGVSSKQKDKARQAFERSARIAGFYNGTEDRLVSPVIMGTGYSGDTSFPVVARRSESLGKALSDFRQEITPAVESASPTPMKGRHPFIEGLLETLPEPKGEWASADRAKWLQAAAQIFDLLYAGGSAEIAVTVKKSGAE